MQTHTGNSKERAVTPAIAILDSDTDNVTAILRLTELVRLSAIETAALRSPHIVPAVSASDEQLEQSELFQLRYDEYHARRDLEEQFERGEMWGVGY